MQLARSAHEGAAGCASAELDAMRTSAATQEERRGSIAASLTPHGDAARGGAPPNTFAVLGSDDELDGGDVLPGFRCRVKQLFE